MRADEIVEGEKSVPGAKLTAFLALQGNFFYHKSPLVS